MNQSTQTRAGSGPDSPSATAQVQEYPAPGRAWFGVFVLMLIYINSFLDRSILALLVDPIRRTLEISESQMGFLMGPAFAVFYIVAGLPLGRLADSMSRRWLVFWGQLTWSLMSVGCAFVTSFPQFLALRMGLGVGESSLSPSAYSLITDLFPRHRLARALSVYGLGIYLGAGLARLLGGVVAGFTEGQDIVTLSWIGRDIYSWQVVFLFIALPTIPLSILLLMIPKVERRSTTGGGGAGAAVKKVPTRELLGYLWLNRTTFLCHSFGFALLSFSGYGVGAWMPSHIMRNFGWGIADTGVALGLINMAAGTLGILAGGWLADTLHQRGVRNNKTMVGLIACVAWFPFGIAYPLMGSAVATMTLYVPAVMVAAMPWGVGPAGIQEIVPNRMRGGASAIYLFIINLLGLGFGPYILSVFTQYVFGGDRGVRWSLLAVPAGAHVVAALLLVTALGPFKQSMDRVKEWEARH